MNKDQFIIIDDDATGCQNVHGIDVVWPIDVDLICQNIGKGESFFVETMKRYIGNY
ncbi:hypothetical protein [Poritiphilus flavus]|uniref:Uncharacterized protein n=1 Tax=Poritiphilus flavus TaxID=2697053 RepID=A0A6L9E7J8_9FLAO|nr:hypothetical protein [Poritiphilus flavus]NAS10611.1 hypothetical protein [Poritiphilus flavus]